MPKITKKTAQKPRVKKTELATTPILPKWKTLEKVTVLITSEQKDAVDDLARQIMRFRSQVKKTVGEKERITSNTIIRALLDNFIAHVSSLAIESIPNEKALKKLLGSLFK